MVMVASTSITNVVPPCGAPPATHTLVLAEGSPKACGVSPGSCAVVLDLVVEDGDRRLCRADAIEQFFPTAL